MRVMVTGGAGYIGSHTCKALAQAGHEVMVYDNLVTGHREFAQWGDFEYGDINDARALARSIRKFHPDAIIHFAAFSQVGESMADPGKYYHNNIGGTLGILNAMRDEGVGSIVVSGSAAVYGQPKKTPITEDMPLMPINPYGASKMFMERMLADFAAACGIKWMSLRYFNAAGSSPECEIGEMHNPETHLVPRIMLAALNKAPAIQLFGTDYPTPDGTCIRDYIHVDDLARAHVLAAAHLDNGGKSMALNLGTGRGYSVREVIEGARKISGKNFPVIEKERRAGDPPSLVADASLAGEVLNWKAQKNLDAMLEDAWNFLSKHY